MDLKRAIMELQCEMVAERNSVNPKNISWLQYDILSQIKKLEKILPSDLSIILGISRTKLSKALKGLKSISIILGISRTKLSKALKGLKSKGYIAQFPNKLDGRELYTTLTDAGNKLLEDIAKKHTSIFEIASKSFTKEEQKTLYDYQIYYLMN